MNMSGYLQSQFKLRNILLTGGLLLIPSSILLAFADRPSRYWSFVFPAFILGTLGCTLLFSNANIAMFRTTPPTLAGTVGAVFNSALQLGSAVGLACLTSIQTSVESKHGGFEAYNGRAAAFWFLLACVVVVDVSMFIFLKEYPGDAHIKDSSLPSVTPSMEEVTVKEKKDKAATP
jgi:MFS family permease